MAVSGNMVAKESSLQRAGFDELPEEWDVATVEELLSDDRGISVGVMYPGDHDPTGIPLIKAGDLTGSTINPRPEFRITPKKHEEYRRTEFLGGEILMTLVGTVGQCAIVPPEMKGWNSARAVAVIRLADPSDAAFVRLCLMSKQLQFLMNAWANTTVQPTLNLKEIRQLPIPWPRKTERDAIANILSSLDDKIELNRRMNETLEAMARALFKSWFVDFDPVRAKMDGRQPAGLSPEIADLFPSEFEHVNGELVPKGWDASKVSDHIEGLYDGPHATPPKAENGAVFLGIKNLTGTTINLSDIRHISENDWPKWTRRVTPQHGDIVFTYEATLGYFALIPPGLRCCLGRRLALVRPRPDRQCGHFLFHTFTSSPFQQHLFTHSIPGATVDRVPLSKFPDYPVLQPTDELIQTFEQIVKPIWQRIHAGQSESMCLATLRDTLLPKLLSGELRVPEAEQLAGEVL